MILESSTWKWLAKARRHYDPEFDLHMQRIENGADKGTPDVEGRLKSRTSALAVDFHLELKATERPARAMTPVRFDLRNREHQIEFMRRRWEMGGACYWLLQVGSGHDRMLYMLPGDAGEKLTAGILEKDLMADAVHFGIFSRKSEPMDVFKQVLRNATRPYPIR